MTFSTRVRRTPTITVAVLVVSLVAGCDGTAPSTPREKASLDTLTSVAIAEPQASQARNAKTLWSRRIDVVGQPVIAGHAALVLARTPGNGIELVSLDRGSGRKNFRMPFHPGGLPAESP
jgi:hypothetical protein